MPANPMGFVYLQQGPYEDAMKAVGTTPIQFTIPGSGFVLVMAQATALCSEGDGGNNLVGVHFELFDHNDAPVTDFVAEVKGQHPAHSTVCMAYLANVGALDAGKTAKITVKPVGGTMSPEDFFSVSVVELEQSADTSMRGESA